MAENKIVIDARINKKGAEADLKSLEASTKSTAARIKDLGKQINSAQTGRSKLQEQLDAARQKAEETAAALDEVNARLDAAHNSRFGVTSQEDVSLSNQLAAQLETQDAKVAEIEAKYQEQNGSLQSLQSQHGALTAQLEQENLAVERQKDLISFISGDDSMQDYFNKQAEAIESTFSKIEERQNKLYGDSEETAAQHAERLVAETRKAVADQDKDPIQRPAADLQQDSGAEGILSQAENAVSSLQSRLSDVAETLSGVISTALRTVGRLGAKAFGAIQKAVQNVRNRLTQSAKALARFRNRLLSIVSSALVFNLVSSGLRKMTEWMGTAMLSSASLRTALGNLEGAAMTAAAPLLQALMPALTAIANAAATAFYYVAQLISFLTGKSISASQSAAKAMSKYAKAAKSAGSAADGALAKFDELDVLDKNNSGSTGDITPNYDFTGENPFLDEILQAIKDGDWYGVGRLIGEKLRDALNTIPWPDIQDKAREWATNIADCINGFIETPGLWEAIGHTVAQGLNTALIFADTLMQGIHWESLGAGIANGLTTAVAEIDWALLGRFLTDGLRAAILTLYGFVQTYEGWADLGNAIATCINSAIENIPWTEAGLGLSGFALGLLDALIAAVEGTDWAALGQDIVSMIGAIDWPGLFASLSTLAADILQAVNDILAQVDWDAVGQKVLECLQAVDWLGILSQLGELLNNSWPLLLATLGVALLPQITNFILNTVLLHVLAALASLIAGVVSAIGRWTATIIAVLLILGAAVIACLVAHWDEIKQKLGETLDNLREKVHSAGEKIKQIWDALWLTVKLIGMQLWEDITQGWNDFWAGLQQALDSAAADIQQGWDDAWNAVSETVSDIWDGITGTIKDAVNSIIGIINGMISAIVGGMNGVIGLLNGFSFDVPEFAQDALGTSKIGFNIDPLTAPQIPYLAQGAVIPANHEFLAVLGDQSNGTNVEAPLATIQQALAEVMEAYGGQERDITIRFAGDLAQLARVLKPYLDKEENRRGAKLVTGGVY